MRSIIIADNLINDYCSPEPEFRDITLNIGIDEFMRLFEDPEEQGAGVLPAVLREAVESSSEDDGVGVIFLRDQHDPLNPDHQEILLRYGDHGVVNSKGSEFLPVVAPLVQSSVAIDTPNLSVPLQDLQNAILELTKGRAEEVDEEAIRNVRILLTGVHTEKRLLNIAHMLRHVMGFRNVAVTPHLIGSANRDAHYTALRYHYPDILVEVFPELSNALTWIGLDYKKVEQHSRHACRIEPQEIREEFTNEQKRIVEAICMHWTLARLKPLKGGFSGSFLFLADGWKDDARTEPMVMKIDSFHSIRRELKGYERVKDLLGKHVPTISPPVSFGDFTGIGMELATMEGNPTTLQDHFENIADDNLLELFMGLFERTLSLLAKNMYGNTLRRRHVAPYRQFMLHISAQAEWLSGNIESILNQPIGHTDMLNPDMVKRMFDIVRKNDDGLETEICLSHGDLNLANLICDTIGNTWAIDWTHADNHPLELDFAKLENDIKFVISKDFEEEDFGKMHRFEEYMLEHAVLPDLNELPQKLRYIAWDLRFKKIYLAIKNLRKTYFSLREGSDWLMYRIALLKYAIHTLSFDKSRNRGECGPLQLWFALASVESLLFQLVADDFQLKIRGERPSSYPGRQRISIDEATWRFDCPDYDPPYHVEAEVLEQDRTKIDGGWADPEDEFTVSYALSDEKKLEFSDDGKPLNPSGRTGMAGRGALGRWGPNPLVIPVITRYNSQKTGLELLVCEISEDVDSLPEDFVNFGENVSDVLQNYIRGILVEDISSANATHLFQDYLYDARQTDNAWIHGIAYLLHLDNEESEVKAHKSQCRLRWQELTPEQINQFSIGKATILRNAVTELKKQGILEVQLAMDILGKSG
ncbi:MAG: hypothetical protein C0600_16680 [Ignavibacteria bacterium]|nr:MAG: hypothetical protein C0600_16680 [Ignavibacteria bacterium]